MSKERHEPGHCGECDNNPCICASGAEFEQQKLITLNALEVMVNKFLKELEELGDLKDVLENDALKDLNGARERLEWVDTAIDTEKEQMGY